ncbi:MAG: DUF3307 domain-containing protein [Verrucomicrobiales bacterium]|nr:DUF3307 domain-containing protein [Verrucomicrobiales bacterium]
MLTEWLPQADADSWSLLSAAVIFFALMIGHSLADFPLQGEFLSITKNRRFQPPAGGKYPVSPRLWIYTLTVHCLIQAGAVWAVTTSPLLAFIEFIVHWLIDFVKCEGGTGFEFDQWLHIGTKIVYVILIWQGLVTLS